MNDFFTGGSYCVSSGRASARPCSCCCYLRLGLSNDLIVNNSLSGRRFGIPCSCSSSGPFSGRRNFRLRFTNDFIVDNEFLTSSGRYASGRACTRPLTCSCDLGRGKPDNVVVVNSFTSRGANIGPSNMVADHKFDRRFAGGSTGRSI